MTQEPRVPLAGSVRRPAPGAFDAGPVDPAEVVEVTLVLRRRAPLPAPVVSAGGLSTEEFVARYGGDPADVDLVTRAVSQAGAEVVEADAPSRRVRVRATAGVLADLFGTSLRRTTSQRPGSGGDVEHRGRTGELSLPGDLAGVVVAVLGLDDRPQAATRTRIAVPHAVATSYTPPQLGTAYRFPAGTDGAGQTLAIVELGGGYAAADLDAYFRGLGLPAPSVRAVGVDGGRNEPGGDPQGADGEVLLDLEVAGALAPRADLVVYFAPNTDAGFLDAVSTAVHATPTPTALSISWGQSEDGWTAQARDALDAAMADGAALGVTVSVAAGDDGSSDRAGDGGVHVDFPASSPHALACGGTRLDADPATGAIRAETVWNGGPGSGATGGGVSRAFALPGWQSGAGVPTRVGAAGGTGATGRGVPDVAGDADPQTGYQVRVDGRDLVIGGTSAVAPLWAALVCRLAQALNRRLGLLQPALYGGVQPRTPVPGLRDVTQGTNGAYRAGPGWDACTGLGVPDGQALLDRLRAPASGGGVSPPPARPTGTPP